MSPISRSGRAPSSIDGCVLAATALLLVLVSTTASPVAASPAPYSRSVEFTVVVNVDSTGVASPVVRLAVPYRALVFKRAGAVWRSSLRVTVVAERDGRRVGGGVGSAAAEASAYAATRSDELLRCAVPVTVRGSSAVDLRVEAEVPGTGRVWREKLEFDPGQGTDLPWYFADFSWNLPGSLDAPRLLGDGIDSLVAVVAIGRRPGVAPVPTTLLALVRHRDDAEPEPVLSLPLHDSDAGLDQTIVFADDDLPFGRCLLVLRLAGSGDGSGSVLDLTPPRPFVNLGMRWADDAEWKRHVAWLEGLTDGDQRNELRDLPRIDRAEGWRLFWDGLAADPERQALSEREHLLRIVSADEKFGRFGRGALSDRGRVYVQYGPPDRVEARGDELSYTAAWEIWYYHAAGLVFAFYDAHGLGDFRLHSRQGY